MEACKPTPPASQKLVVCWVRHSIALQVLSLAVLALSSSGWKFCVCPIFTFLLSWCMFSLVLTHKNSGISSHMLLFERWLGSTRTGQGVCMGVYSFGSTVQTPETYSQVNWNRTDLSTFMYFKFLFCWKCYFCPWHFCMILPLFIGSVLFLSLILA